MPLAPDRQIVTCVAEEREGNLGVGALHADSRSGRKWRSGSDGRPFIVGT
jgi:hypothetical protein